MTEAPLLAPIQSQSRPEVSDEVELCQRIALGDQAAFRVLVDRYQHRVFGFCVRMLGDRAEAGDLAQDVFLAVYQHAHEFRGDAKFSTWALRIARNMTLNRIKYLERRGRAGKHVVTEKDEARAVARPHEGPNPEEHRASNERREMVHEAIEKLDASHRAVVVLRDIEDLSYEEICDITGLPLGTVKSRIHRARTALATHLARIFT